MLNTVNMIGVMKYNRKGKGRQRDAPITEKEISGQTIFNEE